MKKFAKSAVALLLSAVLCMSLGACYDADLTWAAKKGGTEMPIGAYIYYLSVAYNEAAAKIGTDTEVLKGKVEDTDAETWIKDRAMNYVNQFFWMDEELQRLGLEMTEEDLAAAASNTTSYWSYYSSVFEPLGIAQTSFDVAFSQYNRKYSKVFEALYGEGGEREIPAGELESYFLDNYYNYEYFTAPLTTKDADGKSVDLTDEEKEALTKRLEATKKEVSAGDKTVMDAANDYAVEGSDSSSYSSNVLNREGLESAYMPAAFIDTLTAMKEDDVAVFEADGLMVLLKRLPTQDRYAEATEGDNLLSLMLEIKNEEFKQYVEESAASVTGVELNERAISREKPSKFADTTKNGTSSVASEPSEDESSASAAE